MSATVSILGNLGRAPETRMAQDGTFITTFSIASNSIRNSPAGKVEKTDWFRVTAFGNQAKTLAKYAGKGTRLLVQGKLTCEPWTNRDGIPQVGADVVLQDFQFAGSGGEKEERRDNTSSAETDEYREASEFSGNGTDIQEFENEILN
ncbi:MAG TPA: single-stranded DNA-binding protein [Pyrinomonadaceae bacterium]|jgi:single-strand DNA-binding protein|nr:single-stranded DNA-binding protein [Pyrinomonadaceae bacterium]